MLEHVDSNDKKYLSPLCQSSAIGKTSINAHLKKKLKKIECLVILTVFNYLTKWNVEHGKHFFFTYFYSFAFFTFQIFSSFRLSLFHQLGFHKINFWMLI